MEFDEEDMIEMSKTEGYFLAFVGTLAVFVLSAAALTSLYKITTLFSA